MNKTLVIADDNRMFSETLKQLFELQGFTVSCAANGEEALSRITALRPDAALVDIMMPKIDGISLCKMVKSHNVLSSVKIVILTCKEFVEDKERAFAAGADAFLNKTGSPEETVRTVQDLLSSRFSMTFWGTRGSLPAPDQDMMRYGGETS